MYMKKKTLINLIMSLAFLCFLGFSFIYMNHTNLIYDVTDILGPQQKPISKPGYQFSLYGDKESGITLKYPVSVMVYEQGLYVVDQDAGNVKVFDMKGRFAGSFGRMKSPYGIAVYGGNFYISDMATGEIEIHSRAGKKLGILKIKEQRQKMVPGSLLVADKYLYVADLYQGRILVIDLTERKIIRDIGSYGTGKGQLKYPHGMAVDKEGNIYVADSGNNRIVAFDSKGHYLKTLGGPPDKVGSITTVRGVDIDSKEHIYATAPLTGSVQVFNKQGEALYSFGGPGEDEGQLGLPNDLFVDSSGRIYIAEIKNKRVSVFERFSN